MKKTLILFLLCAGITTVNAQFLKKIGGKVKQTADNIGENLGTKVQDRSNKEASDKADKSMDRVFSINKEKKSRARKNNEDDTMSQQPAVSDSTHSQDN